MAVSGIIVEPGDRLHGPGLTSLASKYQSLAREERCPRCQGRWVNTETGEWFWDRCKRQTCLVCGPRIAFATAGAIALAEPERLVRYSLVGEDWQTIRSRLFRVRYRVRQDGFRWEEAYHVERNPKGTGHHVHAYQHGEFVPQARLQELCRREGLGYPDIRSFRTTGELGAAYGLKAATGYGLKDAQRPEALVEYLRLNGGRLVHTSRAFWRDGQNGGRIRGVRSARHVAQVRRYGSRDWEAGVWKLVAFMEEER
jgi:hypothetical protein